MTDREPAGRPPSEGESPKRTWTPPTLEVVPLYDTEGPVNPAFPKTDSITGAS